MDNKQTNTTSSITAGPDYNMKFRDMVTPEVFGQVEEMMLRKPSFWKEKLVLAVLFCVPAGCVGYAIYQAFHP